jgi:hypothetical protein
MFCPYKTIIRQLLFDRNHRTAGAAHQYIYMLPLHVIIIQECMPALHSCYFLVAASMLCFTVCNLPCRACVSHIILFEHQMGTCVPGISNIHVHVSSHERC